MAPYDETKHQEFLNPAPAQTIDEILFYEYPLNPKYLISKCGKVYNTNLDRLLATSTIKNGKGFEYWTVCLDRKRTRVHRMLATTFIANPNGYPWCDHVSRNSLDNSLLNIRWVTPTMNARNVTKRQNTTSEYVGVHLGYGGKWVATIGLCDRKSYLGTYATQEDAARAYNAEAVKYGVLHLNKLN